MSELTKRFVLPLKLQLFAEPGEGGGEGGKVEEKKEDKTFTQEELNSIAKKEKEEGKKAILKELGFEDVKTVKDGLAELKKWQETQKTEAEKAADILKEKEKVANEANGKLKVVQAKLDAIKGGVNPKFVDDVVALAMIKVSDDKDLNAVLEEMKKTYPNFFVESDEDDEGNKGTGNKINNKKKDFKVEGIGERLAKQGLQVSKEKSSYFRKG